jgi:predicted  nucleic acid-binding Zn-ribbon protein
MLMPLAGGAAWYINDLRTQLAISQANEAKLNQALETQEAAITSMRRDFQLQTEQLNAVNNEFAAIRQQNQNLIGKLERHDLGLLAEQRASLVERTINRATAKANRCFEILSGAELTENERNAENGNKFNSECPWLWQPAPTN